MYDYEAGPSLDLLVAEKVMGWTECEGYFGVPPDEQRDPRLAPRDRTMGIPGYSTDCQDADKVTVHLESKGFLYDVVAEPSGRFRAAFRKPSEPGIYGIARGETKAHATCLAALDLAERLHGSGDCEHG